MAELVRTQGRAMGDKLLAVIGREGVAAAQETLEHLLGALDAEASAAAPHATALAERVRGLLPGADAAGWIDDVVALVAAGADALPCYRYLVARLAAETSLAWAKHLAMPDVPLPEPRAGAPVAVPPPPPLPPSLLGGSVLPDDELVPELFDPPSDDDEDDEPLPGAVATPMAPVEAPVGGSPPETLMFAMPSPQGAAPVAVDDDEALPPALAAPIHPEPEPEPAAQPTRTLDGPDDDDGFDPASLPSQAPAAAQPAPETLMFAMPAGRPAQESVDLLSPEDDEEPLDPPVAAPMAEAVATPPAGPPPETLMFAVPPERPPEAPPAPPPVPAAEAPPPLPRPAAPITLMYEPQDEERDDEPEPEVAPPPMPAPAPEPPPLPKEPTGEELPPPLVQPLPPPLPEGEFASPAPADRDSTTWFTLPPGALDGDDDDSDEEAAPGVRPLVELDDDTFAAPRPQPEPQPEPDVPDVPEVPDEPAPVDVPDPAPQREPEPCAPALQEAEPEAPAAQQEQEPAQELPPVQAPAPEPVPQDAQAPQEPPVPPDPPAAPAPGPTVPPPVAGAWPTASLPEAVRLRGVYLDAPGPAPRWLVFTLHGVFSDAPPAVPDTVDWDAHHAAGHRVGTYRRQGDRLRIVLLDGSTTDHDVDRSDRLALTVDGARWPRADWDLTGRKMDGIWHGPGADGTGTTILALGTDGRARLGTRTGSYALGIGRITFTWDGGRRELTSLLTDLAPSSRHPDRLWLGGVRFDRQA
ncbi:MAG: hypothetical protein R3F59_37560 [Myxococcota bacterium]